MPLKKTTNNLPNLRRLLIDPTFETECYKGIRDTGKYVCTWLAGYSKSETQTILESLYSYINTGMPGFKISTKEDGESLLDSRFFHLSLKTTNKVKYDPYAVEVILRVSAGAQQSSEAEAAYGYCPICGLLLFDTTRERSPHREDRCLNLHIYPGSFATATSERIDTDQISWGQAKSTVYNLGLIPRDKGLSKSINLALRKRRLHEPLLTKFTTKAPMKEPQRMLNIKIAIPYDDVIIVGNQLVSLDEALQDYGDISDMLELL